MFGDVRVAFELVQEIGAVTPGMFNGPGLHRIALHQFVSLFAGEALFDEGQQNGLRIPQTERQLEVFLHVLGINQQALDQLGERHEHIIEQRAGIREDDALD